MPSLGCYSPWGGNGAPRHGPACEYLSIDRRATKGISSTHLVWGRGAAKTTTCGQMLHRIAYVDMPGAPLFWTEPRDADIDRIFLPMLEDLVPRKYWEYKGSPRQVTFSSGTKLDLVSRNVDNPRKKVGIGPTYAGGWVDEAAEKFTLGRWNDLKNSVRLDGVPYRFLDSATTPVMNAYYELCMRPHHRVIHASSFDNPFISREAIEDMIADMSPSMISQEIYGQWMRHEGRVWASFSEDDYPAGNLRPEVWDPARPWHLAMDLGQALGHWQIIQYHGAAYPTDERRVGVVVAEGLQRQESMNPVIARIAREYGKHKIPSSVSVGSDVTTLGMTGPAPAQLLNERGWPCTYPTGELTSKSTQQQTLERLILDTTGARRFCLSREMERHGPTNQVWGILNCMRTDAFPEPGGRDWFLKDKKSANVANCEDPRDSALYWAVCKHPLKWTTYDRFAA